MPPRSRPFATAIIVAAGRGVRFGAADKALTFLRGRPVLSYALDSAESATSIDAIVIVAGEHTYDAISNLTASGQWSKLVATVVGGERRQDSVASGLAAVPATTQLVAVHDAARPLATASLFDACIEAASLRGAAIAATPVADTLKRVRDGVIVQTVSRESLWAAQTPQVFQREILERAFVEAAARGLDVTDEAALLEALGLPVAIVPSSFANIKITRPEDLAIAEALLMGREAG